MVGCATPVSSTNRLAFYVRFRASDKSRHKILTYAQQSEYQDEFAEYTKRILNQPRRNIWLLKKIFLETE